MIVLSSSILYIFIIVVLISSVVITYYLHAILDELKKANFFVELSDESDEYEARLEEKDKTEKKTKKNKV